jgi:hypothetical protein
MDLMLSHLVERICRITVVDLVGSITLIQFRSLKKNQNQRKRTNNRINNLTMRNLLINLQDKTIFSIMNQLRENTVLISLDPDRKLTNNLHKNHNSSHLRENQLIQKKNKSPFKRILSFMVIKIPITITVTPSVINN